MTKVSFRKHDARRIWRCWCIILCCFSLVVHWKSVSCGKPNALGFIYSGSGNHRDVPRHSGLTSSVRRGQGDVRSVPARRARIVSDILDVNRAGIWVEGLGPYAVVSALMLNSAMRLYLTCNEDEKDFSIPYRLAYATCIVCTIVSVFSSTFTTVVFVFIKMYGLTSLGMSKDNEFTLFVAATRVQRLLGFRCFLISLYSFLMGVSAHLFLMLRGVRGVLAALMALVLSLYMAIQWSKILAAAAIIVFAP